MSGRNAAWIVGDVVYIDVSTRKFPQAISLIDAADMDLVFADLSSRSRWHVFVPRSGTAYVGRFVGSSHGPCGNQQRFLFLHRTILGLAGSVPFVDHVNLDGLDNRRSNLRLATRSQNSANRRGLGAIYKGVGRSSKNRFGARIRVDGALRGLGSFLTAEAAARAYDVAAREAFGEYARLNFPEELAA